MKTPIKNGRIVTAVDDYEAVDERNYKKPMRNFWRGIFVLIACFGFGLYGFSIVFSQNTEPSKPASINENQSKSRCSSTTANSGEKMTYQLGESKLSAEDKKRIEDNIGKLTIPKGEVKRAKKIREQALKKRAEQKSVVEEGYQNWLKKNPNASPDDAKRMLELVEFLREKVRKFEPEIVAKNKRFDWREHGPLVGPVLNQGANCDTCWAFASASAFEASLKLLETRFGAPVFATSDGLVYLEQAPPASVREVASVQQLLNCMPTGETGICSKGWHGKAFNFMVNEKGMPLMWESWDKYNADYEKGVKSKCKPQRFAKAYSWDYVNYPPDKLPTEEQLKIALIEHGPLVAPIKVDNCLRDYRGGIFNEQNPGNINHALLLIGWDDDKQAWLVKNSWGEEWGEKGFAWIKYRSNNIGAYAAWIDATPQF